MLGLHPCGFDIFSEAITGSSGQAIVDERLKTGSTANRVRDRHGKARRRIRHPLFRRIGRHVRRIDADPAHADSRVRPPGEGKVQVHRLLKAGQREVGITDHTGPLRLVTEHQNVRLTAVQKAE